MFTNPLFFRVLVILSLSGMVAVMAQNSPPIRRTVSVPGAHGQASPASSELSSGLLKSNYRVVVKVTKGDDQPAGTVSILTCSPKVSVDGPLDSEITPSSMSLVGSLEERGEELVFTYQLGLTIPVASSVRKTHIKGEAPVVSNITYRSFAGSGTLRMKVGQAYVVLVSGGTSYSITISPEPSD